MVMAIVKFQTESGIEVYIDNETGEAFTTVSGYARMAGVSKSTVNERIGTVRFSESEMAETLTATGLKTVRKVSVDFIAEYLPRDNSDLATEMIR